MPDVVENGAVLEQAFILMEVEPPSSFEDGSAKAEVAAAQFARAFDIVLESYDWSHARKIAILPEVNLEGEGILADPDLPYAVRLPADCVALRRVHLDDEHRWRVDDDLIRTDKSGGITVRYTSNGYRLKFMPATFQQVVAYQLALLLASKWVKTRTKRRDLRDEFSDALYAARTNDAHTASVGRLDGQPAYVDWADEARS